MTTHPAKGQLLQSVEKVMEENPGDGLVYLHPQPGRAQFVVMTLDRFQREMGGDPGHDDDFPHTHLYGG